MGRNFVGLFLAALLAMGIVGGNAAYGGHVFDPFGGPTNQSLVLDNFDGGNASPVDWPFAWWNFGQVYTDGVLEFDLYMDFSDATVPTKTTGGQDSFWTYVDVRFGQTGGGLPSGVLDDTAIYDSYRVQNGNGQFYFENTTAPENGHPFLAETAQHVKYTIDGTARTYVVEVTPHAVSGETTVQRVAGTDENPWRSAHFFAGNTGFDVFAIGSAFGLDSSPFYIDNLKFTSGGNTILDETFDDDPLGGVPDTAASATATNSGTNGTGFIVEIVGPVPEPSSILLAVFASACLTVRGRRR